MMKKLLLFFLLFTMISSTGSTQSGTYELDMNGVNGEVYFVPDFTNSMIVAAGNQVSLTAPIGAAATFTIINNGAGTWSFNSSGVNSGLDYMAVGLTDNPSIVTTVGSRVLLFSFSIDCGVMGEVLLFNNGDPNAPSGNWDNSYNIVILAPFYSGDAYGANSGSGIDCASALPVVLSGFDVKKENRSAFVFWETSAEINNKGFELQKSADGVRWEEIAWIDGQGTTYTAQFYSHIDNDPFFGPNYYRLRQLDFDGAENYSPVRVITFNADGEKALVYPNPVIDELFINLPEDIEGEVRFEVLDVLRRVVLTESLDVDQDRFQSIDVSLLTPGSYYLKVRSRYFEEFYPFVRVE